MFRAFLKFITVVILLVPQGLVAAPGDPVIGDLGWQGGANDNPHNLSSLATHSRPKASPGETTEICVFCHTPHGATPQTPLWSRPDPARMGSFTTYNSAILDASGQFAIATIAASKYGDNTTPGEEYPNGASKLCLSCHDGVTSIGVLANGRSIAMTSGTITDPAMYWDPLNPGAGMDFSKSHPVSFVYDAVVLPQINALKTDLGAGSEYKLPDAGSRIKLEARAGTTWMQCTTCHEPHKDTKHGTTYPYPFWRNAGVGTEAQDYDLTCAECHNSTIGPATPTPHNNP
ncbi:MAG: hypothetical protein A2091_03410 [Desulfuromonadales bacterium GWD2_61_12]|nr:MAG: hypothetical protein A2005_06270 [Desulfuromonadales bacterium GWC2_61_20]OGR34950.1 MAG: hypothetical protein A2091_03410 [Desulfuromonadales bacterium GWD2_61_12]HAD04441.1 hypothetical protein [Desulfuromonas sp.]